MEMTHAEFVAKLAALLEAEPLPLPCQRYAGDPSRHALKNERLSRKSEKP